MRSVELFAGAGGLALGTELAGFRPAVTVEWDKWACDTMRENQKAGFPLVANWTVHEGDVRLVDWHEIGGVDLVTGGPPCQPFSMGGKARADTDPRDMFPATAEVIRELRPKAFLIENVRGLTRAAFANYFQYILLRLQHPAHAAEDYETWDDHLRRLQAIHTTPSVNSLHYNIVWNLVNAADYGVPQQRHRVFFIGFREDVDADYAFPKPTHSLEALLHDQWVTGVYWDRHKIPTKHRPEPESRWKAKIRRLHDVDRDALGEAWVTVRDALTGLPVPGTRSSSRFRNHVLQPGARSYPGHTGSPLDMPAKALKAGAHGVPGGENMLRELNGDVRYFTIRESARIQTFPDEYELHGAWSEAMRQLGNAVPVKLAQIVAESVYLHLFIAGARETLDVEHGTLPPSKA